MQNSPIHDIVYSLSASFLSSCQIYLKLTFGSPWCFVYCCKKYFISIFKVQCRMVYLCVICMVRLPPLVPLSVEHRRIIEAIVSPILNIAELRTCNLLACYHCVPELQSMQVFCQKALAGVTNLLTLHRLINQLHVEVTFRTEPVDLLPGPTVENVVTESRNNEYTPTPPAIKNEHQNPMFTVQKEVVYVTEALNSNTDIKQEVKHEPEFNLEPDHGGPEVLTAPTIPVRNVPINMPTVTQNDEQFEYFTHRRRIELSSEKAGFCNPDHQSQKREETRYFNSVSAACTEPQNPKVKVRPAPVQCDICLKMFFDMSGLRRHQKRQHKECDECGRVCKCSKAIKPTYCAECDITFAKPSLYQVHMKSKKHAKEADYRFECDTCGMRFVTIRRLRIHVDTHTDTQYPCQHCDKEFNTALSRKRHIKKTHERHKQKRNFICDYCGKAFDAKCLVSQHINSHTGARPHVCKICGDTFGYKSALYLHGRYKHKIQKITKNTKKNSKQK